MGHESGDLGDEATHGVKLAQVAELAPGVSAKRLEKEVVVFICKIEIMSAVSFLCLL